MISQSVLPATDESSYCISGVDVIVRAPRRLQLVLDRMLAHVSRDCVGTQPPLQIDARCESDVWHIGGTAPSSKKVLCNGSALPQVAGAVVASVLAEIAHYHDLNVWRAAVVEHDGKALVLAGDDWESCITLAAHLHTRGWRLLSGDYALVSRDTFSAISFKKSLHANSSCIASFPLWYRAAVEASPWYSSADLLAFYAIDPTLVGSESPWGERAPIRAFLQVDGHTAEHPSLEIGDDLLLTDGLRRHDLMRCGIEVAMLVRSDFNETCDFIERWFMTLGTCEEYG